MRDSGTDKWHVDKATVVSKEEHISDSHASNPSAALLNVSVSLKLCGKKMPKGTGNLQHLRELLFQVNFFFLTELHRIFTPELLKSTSFTSH